jgi:hypothetical protein
LITLTAFSQGHWHHSRKKKWIVSCLLIISIHWVFPEYIEFQWPSKEEITREM